jgi:hypothetical protein
MNYKLSYIHGHVEVFDDAGKFIFSADDHREAMEEIKKRQAAFAIKEREPAA